MARPVMQTGGSIGVSYIIFRGLKHLLADYVPEEWQNVEEKQLDNVNVAVKKVAEAVQDKIPKISEDTVNNSTLLRAAYDALQQAKLHEIALYIITIIIVVILPPLMSIHNDKKKKELMARWEKPKKDESSDGDANSNIPEEPTQEDGSKENTSGEPAHNDELSDSTQPPKDLEDSSNLSLTKDNNEIVEGSENEEDIEEVVLHDSTIVEDEEAEEEESTETPMMNEVENHSGIQQELNRLDEEEQQQHFLQEQITPNEIDPETGFEEVDNVGPSLEPEQIEDSENPVSLNEESDGDSEEDSNHESAAATGPQDIPNEKEILESTDEVVLEKAAEQPREIPPLLQPTGLSFDSRSSMNSQFLHAAETPSYIQFSPTKASHLKVEINKKKDRKSVV